MEAPSGPPQARPPWKQSPEDGAVGAALEEIQVVIEVVLQVLLEVVHVADMNVRRKLRVAYDSIFGKIFGFRYHESVREPQSLLGRLTLIKCRKVKFSQSAS